MNADNAIAKPTAAQVGAVIQQAAAAAVAVAQNGASSPGTVSALQAFENGIDGIGEALAGAFGGATGAAVATIALPEVVPVVVNSLVALFQKIGHGVPAELQSLWDDVFPSNIAPPPAPKFDAQTGAPLT
jgi:hypothetical protein